MDARSCDHVHAGPSWIFTSAIVKLTRSLQIDHADSSTIITGRIINQCTEYRKSKRKENKKQSLGRILVERGDQALEYAESSLIRRRAKNHGDLK
ncbi:hypothetical protein HL42_2706 [Trichophyton rubrum]|nr:hypothetical protein HL42_2706 [Trichophyton rubrum]